MKKTTMRAAAAMMTAAMALTSFTGCSKILNHNGGSGNNGGGSNVAEKLGVSFAHSYKAEKLDFDVMSNIQNIDKYGSKILIRGYDSSYNDVLSLYDPTTGSAEQVEFNYLKNLGDNTSGYPTSLFTDNQNRLNVIFGSYTWGPSEGGDDDAVTFGDDEENAEETEEETAAAEETEEETTADEETEEETSGEDTDSDSEASDDIDQSDEYADEEGYYDNMEYKELPMVLEIYDENMNVIETRELETDSDVYYYAVVANPAGGFYASTWDDTANGVVITTLDENFQKTGKVGGSMSYVQSMFTGKDGSVYLNYSDQDNNNCFGKIDSASNTVTQIEISGMPQWFNYSFVSQDDKYDLYISDSTAIYGISIANGTCEEAVNWLNSDFNGSTVNNVAQLPDGRFVVSSYDDNNYDKCSIWALTERPEDAFKDVSMITMAGVYLPDDLYRAVLQFNRTHDDTRIALANYEKYNTEDNYDGALTQLKNDMTSGIVADLIVTTGLPYESFVNKGIFEDLTPRMTDLNDETYFMSYFNSLKYGDKLYHIGSSFDVETLMGKKDIVGTKEGLTFDEFMALCKGLPEGTEVFDDMNKQAAMELFIQDNITAFTDLEKHTCTFNSEQFISTLEFCNSFPSGDEDPDKYSEWSEDDWAEQSYRFINGKVAFNRAWISDLKQAYREEYEYFGGTEDTTRVGFPIVEGKGGNGGRFSIGNTVAMSANSKVKDQCWEYMSYLLSDEFQEGLSYALPVKRSAFEKQVEKAMKPDTYTDENGKEVESPMTIWRGNDDYIEVPNMPKSFADDFKAYIEGITTSTYYDQTIYTIVQEECEKFFSGDQTAQQAADMIQSRVSLYLSEQG